MKTLELLGGDDIYDVLAKATKIAADEPVKFDFNGCAFEVAQGESFEDASRRFTEASGIPVLSPDESARRSLDELERMKREQSEAIAAAGVMNEEQLREFKAPTPKSLDELVSFVRSLVERPHDYGTCVYAMSLTATATFNFVARQLGVTGFQASCADLDVIRRIRHMEHGFKILDFNNLLYPQTANDEKFPSWHSLLNDPEMRAELRKAATERLAETEMAHPGVIAHWRKIVSEDQF